MLLTATFSNTTTAQDCNYRQNDSDPTLGISQRKVAFTLWFSTRDEELKSHAKGDNMTCKVSMGNLSGSKELSVSIVALTDKPAKVLGQIGVGYPMKIIIEGGEIIELKARSADVGKVDAKANTTTFETSYRLSEEEFEKFRTTPVKKLRIFWTEARFTDHDVLNPKLLMEQAECLK